MNFIMVNYFFLKDSGIWVFEIIHKLILDNQGNNTIEKDVNIYRICGDKIFSNWNNYSIECAREQWSGLVEGGCIPTRLSKSSEKKLLKLIGKHIHEKGVF